MDKWSRSLLVQLASLLWVCSSIQMYLQVNSQCCVSDVFNYRLINQFNNWCYILVTSLQKFEEKCLIKTGKTLNEIWIQYTCIFTRVDDFFFFNQTQFHISQNCNSSIPAHKICGVLQLQHDLAYISTSFHKTHTPSSLIFLIFTEFHCRIKLKSEYFHLICIFIFLLCYGLFHLPQITGYCPKLSTSKIVHELQEP